MTEEKFETIVIEYSIEQFMYEVKIEFDPKFFKTPNELSELGNEIVNDAFAGRETRVDFGNTYLMFVNGVLSGTTSHLQRDGHFEVNIRMTRNRA